MDKLVVLKLEGDFETAGFRVTMEIRAEPRLLKVKGYLPPAPEVATQIHRHWQQNYRSLGMPLRIKGEKITHKGSLNRRILDCQESAQVLRDRFRHWLNAESFQSIDRRLREELSRDDTIRFLIRTNDLRLQKLPWQEWDFFERYPKAEVALSAPEYEAIPSRKRIATKATVKVLAILGNNQGICLERDRQLLEQLPHAEIEFLVEPDRQQLSDRLWNKSWDILFFAGHSRTEGESGRIYINQTDSFTLTELKYGLRQAIDRGLQLAIFNSCDGLGLAQELHQLRIPQLIVMREPIADQVAAIFLQYFLAAFAAGESLYLAERQARERLQGLEHQFPCASWLPIIYQNPLVTPPNWRNLCGYSDLSPTPGLPSLPRLKSRGRSTRFWISLLATFAVLAIRSSGLLQPIELAAYDHLMRLRPAEAIDPRILVVEVTQADVNQQGGYPLTDATLVKAIVALQSLDPVAIGLDMHRFQPRGAGRQDLIAQFQQNPKLLTVCAFNSADRNYAAPPELSANQQIEQVGFSNLVIDRFSVWRSAPRSDIQTATAEQSEGSMVRRQILPYDPNLAPRRSSSISTTAGTARSGGNGGDIWFNGGFIVAVPSENSDITANAFTGSGGSVDVTAERILGFESGRLTPQSDITTSSEFGTAGTISLNTPDVDPTQGLTELPADVVDASDQIAIGCSPTATAQANRGEFYQTGRGGIAPSPTDPIASSDILEDLQPPASWSASTEPTAQIVEAQGWQMNDRGEVMLVASTLPRHCGQ